MPLRQRSAKSSKSDPVPLPQRSQSGEEDFDLRAIGSDEDVTDVPAPPDSPQKVVHKRGKGKANSSKAEDIHYFFTIVDAIVVNDKGEKEQVKQKACKLCM
jgi:hypothetical protein